MEDEKHSLAPSIPPTGSRRDVPSDFADFKGSFVFNDVSKHRGGRVSAEYKTRTSSWIAYFREGWNDVHIWKSAFIEFVATSLLCYLSGLIDTTIGNFQTIQAPAYAGVTNIFLVTLFIMAAGPGSGAHLNSMITFATMVTGLTGFSRGILYIISQVLGAALAGGLSLRPRKLIADEVPRARGGGCFINPGTVSNGQALLIESFSSFAILFLAFGVGLDPRQQKLFGPLAGPLAVGCSLGLVAFASAGLVPGYTGAQMHPDRCLAFAIARHDFTGEASLLIVPREYSVVQIKASAIDLSDVKTVGAASPDAVVPQTLDRDFAGIIVDGNQKNIGKGVWGTGGTYWVYQNGTHNQAVLPGPP
ncbi:MAG: hypothetical protein M1827_004862 [Pycnora praestabilis]|nr:MAG: hypothetical protein M1827_004862 [Pycnora praestabilis]